MKKFAVLIIITMSLWGCAAKEEILPDLGANVAGTYKAYYLEVGTTKTTLPNNNGSITITFTRLTRTTCSYTEIYTINGKVTSETGTYKLELDKTDNAIDLIEDDEFMGFVDSNELTLIMTSNGTKTTVLARK